MGEEKIILTRDAYPRNSIKKSEDEEPEARPKREPIAKAVRVRKSFLQRLRGTFNEGGAGSEVMNYILHDVVIPAAKSTFADLVEGAIEMVLFQGERSPRVRRAGGRSYVSYADAYRSPTRGRERSGYEARSRPVRFDFTGVVLENRAEAEHVLDEMALNLEQYDVVTVADLYELVGIDTEFTDHKYGWTELEGVGTGRCRNGWTLNLPRPRVID